MLSRLVVIIAFFSFIPNANADYSSSDLLLGSLTAQRCPGGGLRGAPQLTDPRDDIDEERREKKDDEDAIKDLRAKINNAKKGLKSHLTPSACRVVFKHMEQRGDGAGLVNCAGPVRGAPVPSTTPYCIPGPDSPLTDTYHEAPDLPPQNAPRAHPRTNTTSDNTPLYCDRMPAADTPRAVNTPPNGGASAPVVPTPQEKPDDNGVVAFNPSGTPPPVKPAPTPPATKPTEGAAPAPPPIELARGEEVFCDGDRPRWWERYAGSGGHVNPIICEDRIPGVQRVSSSCESELQKLEDLYGELAELNQDRNQHGANEEGFSEGGHRPKRRGHETSMQRQMMNMLRGLQAASASLRRQPAGYGPFQPNSPNYALNYGSGGYNGLASSYNGQYGWGPGGTSQGFGGCNNVNNPNLFGNPVANSMLQPWMNGVGPTWGAPRFPQRFPMAPGQLPFPQGIRPPGFPGTGYPPGYGQVAGGQFPPGFRPPGFGGAPMALPGYGPGVGGAGGYFPPPPGVASLGYGGGLAPGALPYNATLGGQIANGYGNLSGWGYGAVPNYGSNISGGYVGAGYSGGYQQSSYLNVCGGAPCRLPGAAY